MNKYTELSDFEINKKVANRLGLLPYLFVASDVGELIWNVPSNDNYYGFISKRGCKLDFCHTPSNSMPIIIENKICTAFDVFAEEHDGGNWVASPAYGFASERTRSNNLYRAAMELFLLMKDAENEG
ncbi:DUF2591 family protein [Providencia rettgeri]|nr:DUF2591 family protein [Providencia rettgeri]